MKADKPINGHKRERRYRLYAIHEGLILSALNAWRKSVEYIVLPKSLDLPADYEIHGVQHDLRYLGFAVLVWSADFLPVPPNVEIPFAGTINFENVVVRIHRNEHAAVDPKGGAA